MKVVLDTSVALKWLVRHIQQEAHVEQTTDRVLVTADRRYLNKAAHLGHIVDLPDWRGALLA